MAAIYLSHSHRPPFTILNSSINLPPSIIIKYYSSSPQPTINGGKDGEKTRKNENLKRPTKTPKSLTMARLINAKPWNTNLTSSLSSHSLSKTTVSQILHLIKDPTKAHNFFIYAQRNSFVHNDQTCLLTLEKLGKNRNLNAARNFLFSIEKNSNGIVKPDDRFYNSLIRNYGRAGLFNEAIKLFSEMKSVGVNPSSVTFNNLLSILLKRGRTGLARKVFDEMRGTYGVTPDTYTFNILIRGFAMNSMMDESFHFFNEMSKVRCEPDRVTYNTLVDGLCRAGKVGVAHNVIKGMVKKKEKLGFSPDVVTYTTLIRGYCMKQEIDEALVVFEDMVSDGLKPNKITYNTVIKGLCEAKRLDKIKEIMDGISLEGGEFAPDACTFNILMNAHCNGGKLIEALKVFEKMVVLGVQPDSASYSVLIRSYCQKHDFQSAEKLFDELSEKDVLLRDDGCVPLVAAYRHIFEYLCVNGKTKKAEKVFRQLMKRGKQDPPCYKTLIMGHCKENNFESGYDLLILMLRRDFDPDIDIYESLVNGLLTKDNPLLAYNTVEKMLKTSSIHPKTHTIHSVLAGLLKNGCARESASLIVLMLNHRIRQNITLSTDTLKLLYTKGLQDKAFETVVLLYKNGFSIEMEELVTFLCHHRKILDARRMLLFCLENHEKLMSSDVCNQVISGLCKKHKVSEAFGLYYDLVEKGLQEHLKCLDDLRSGLEAQGKLSEAEFVLKRMPKQRN